MTISEIQTSLQDTRNQLLNHSLYQSIKTIDDLRSFMEIHVYAVWDFMSLLKALQSKLTCTTTPWMPVGNPSTRYLINEIVVAEETDLAFDGSRLSHFEMYLKAMEASGANTSHILQFLEHVKNTKNIFVAIKQSDLHPNVKAFLDFTFRVVEEGAPHQIAAAFTFGREDLIPSMFTEILKQFQAQFPTTDLSQLIYYFERHIELDGDDHGPMAMQMIQELCGNDHKKWQEVVEISKMALQKRADLWDAIESTILESEPA